MIIYNFTFRIIKFVKLKVLKKKSQNIKFSPKIC